MILSSALLSCSYNLTIWQFLYLAIFILLKAGKMSYSYINHIAQNAQIPTFEKFSRFVLENQDNITPLVFSQDFGSMQKIYMKSKQRDLFCSQADELAGKLVKSSNNDFAGIIMSALCKITEFFPDKLEKKKKKGYEIAKNNGDYVHMMARLNNLRKVYQGRYDKLYDYIQVLYKQEKCLKEMTNHYESAIGTYQSVVRNAASREDYENMLAYVQTEIGKLTRKKHPDDAQAKLLNAREIFERHGNLQSVGYINMLLSKIQNNIY